MTRRFRSRKVKLNQRATEILHAQLSAFRKKFGRDPEDGDPVFFDPRADVPKALGDLQMMDMIVDAMIASGTTPQVIYAYGKTGFIVTESNKDLLSKEQLDEWNAAIDEFFELKSKPQ